MYFHRNFRAIEQTITVTGHLPCIVQSIAQEEVCLAQSGCLINICLDEWMDGYELVDGYGWMDKRMDG